MTQDLSRARGSTSAIFTPGGSDWAEGTPSATQTQQGGRGENQKELKPATSSGRRLLGQRYPGYLDRMISGWPGRGYARPEVGGLAWGPEISP